MKLTNRAIKAFKYRSGWNVRRDVRWDDEVVGLGVRIYPSARKSFIILYRAKGRKRLMVLGRYGTMTLAQAREKARKELVAVRNGKDPLEQQRRTAQGQTFGDLAVAYMERHAKAHKRTWREDQRRLDHHIPPTWRGRLVGGITRRDVSTLHGKIGATAPYEANRLLSLLRLMFNLGQQWGFLDEGTTNPAANIKRFTERKRKRWVTPEELPRLAQEIDGEPNVYVRAALWLYLLTGLRKTELLQARRKHIDWTRGTLRLPETKAGEEQTVSLSGPALAIMQSIPEVEGNPYLLPGKKPGHHLVNIDKPWRRIREAAGLADVRLHDLRRTTGSWMTQAGVDLNLVKEALRHANIATTLIYARLGQDAAREAMEEHGRRILEAAKRKGPVEVLKGGGTA